MTPIITLHRCECSLCNIAQYCLTTVTHGISPKPHSQIEDHLQFGSKYILPYFFLSEFSEIYIVYMSSLHVEIHSIKTGHRFFFELKSFQISDNMQEQYLYVLVTMTIITMVSSLTSVTPCMCTKPHTSTGDHFQIYCLVFFPVNFSEIHTLRIASLHAETQFIRTEHRFLAFHMQGQSKQM